MSNVRVISITDNAANKIKDLIDSRGKPSVGIRFGVKPSGCASWKYIFEYADELLDSDTKINFKNVNIILNRKHEFYLLGTTIDYVENDLQEGFVFNNPNAKGGCGCGESFNA